MNPIDIDIQYLKYARNISILSKDPSTKTGAVITQGGTMLSCGYNRLPLVMPEKNYYENREEKYDRIIHCEMAAIQKVPLLDLSNCTLYTYPFASCTRCVVHMIDRGIRHFVFPEIRWGNILDKTKSIILECNCTYIEYKNEDLNI